MERITNILRTYDNATWSITENHAWFLIENDCAEAKASFDFDGTPQDFLKKYIEYIDNYEPHCDDDMSETEVMQTWNDERKLFREVQNKLAEVI